MLLAVDVCCVLCVVCCLLVVVCCLMCCGMMCVFVDCGWFKFVAVCWSSVVGRCLLCVICWLLLVVCCLLCVDCCCLS